MLTTRYKVTNIVF